MGQVFKVKRNGDLFEAPTEIPGPDRRVLVDEVGEFISEADIDISLLDRIPSPQVGQTAPVATPAPFSGGLAAGDWRLVSDEGGGEGCGAGQIVA